MFTGVNFGIGFGTKLRRRSATINNNKHWPATIAIGRTNRFAVVDKQQNKRTRSETKFQLTSDTVHVATAGSRVAAAVAVVGTVDGRHGWQKGDAMY